MGILESGFLRPDGIVGKGDVRPDPPKLPSIWSGFRCTLCNTGGHSLSAGHKKSASGSRELGRGARAKHCCNENPRPDQAILRRRSIGRRGPSAYWPTIPSTANFELTRTGNMAALFGTNLCCHLLTWSSRWSMHSVPSEEHIVVSSQDTRTALLARLL